MSVSERPLPVHAPMNQFATGRRPACWLAASPAAPWPPGSARRLFMPMTGQLLSSRVAELRAALPKNIKLHYAMKANPMPALVCAMAGLVDGIDVASGGELKVALDAGANPAEISFAGPGKRHGELASGGGGRCVDQHRIFPRSQRACPDCH